MARNFDFEFVEKHVRKKSFAVFSTIDSKGRPHSTGILYGVAPKSARFALYILAGTKYVKVRNVQRNPNVSLVVTFPHYYIRFAPASYVMFRGTAEILPSSDPTAREAFSSQRILRMNLNTDMDEHEMVFIKITPEPRVVCYGLGIGIMEMRGDHTNAGYSVVIPEGRL
jgi:nitroimidazol reductase NimA-like FMN-containing flavoprotein (pyridoxamine 5'-phosphate oxidase superfamily)